MITVYVTDAAEVCLSESEARCLQLADEIRRAGLPGLAAERVLAKAIALRADIDRVAKFKEGVRD